MARNRFPIPAALAAALALAAGAALAAMTMSGEEPVEKKQTVVKLKVASDAGADAIVLDDLHELEVGESRSFTTDTGKLVVATRTEKGFELDVDGKTIEISDFAGELGDMMVWHSKGDGHGEGGEAGEAGEAHRFVFEKKIEIADDAEGKTMVWHSESGEGPARIHVIKRHGEAGEPAGFAFTTGDLPAGAHFGPLSADFWIGRLEKTDAFQELDEASREIVRRALREAAAKGPTGPGLLVLDVEEKQ